jgi:hypothetical protein
MIEMMKGLWDGILLHLEQMEIEDAEDGKRVINITRITIDDEQDIREIKRRGWILTKILIYKIRLQRLRQEWSGRK